MSSKQEQLAEINRIRNLTQRTVDINRQRIAEHQDSAREAENEVTPEFTYEVDCIYGCGKKGIPILPTVLSHLDYKINHQDERYFSHEIIEGNKDYTAIAALPTHTYLYCLFESSHNSKKSWKLAELLVEGDGSLKWLHEYVEASLLNTEGVDSADQSTRMKGDNGGQPFNCTKAQHSTLASKFITVDMNETVWMMVSHARLSKSVLKKYVEDVNLRSMRMQKFIANDLAMNLNTKFMSKNQKEYIQSSYRRKALSNGQLINSRLLVKEKSAIAVKKDVDGVYGFHRQSSADANNSTQAAKLLYNRMQHSINLSLEESEYFLQRQNIPKLREEVEFFKQAKPMIVALPDPVGEVIAAAEKRNYLLKELDNTYNEENMREYVNAIIIDNIKDSIAEQNTSGIHERIGASRAGLSSNHKQLSAINKNIYQYINRAKFEAVIEQAKTSRNIKQEIAKARDAFIKAIKHPDFAFVMREDFVDDSISHLGFSSIIAQAFAGLGIDEANIGIPDSLWANATTQPSAGTTAKQEFEQVLYPVINQKMPLADNWLIKALIGLNPDDMERMSNPPEIAEPAPFDKFDRASDFVGTATNWVLGFQLGQIAELISTKSQTTQNKRQSTQNSGQAIKQNYALTINDINALAQQKAQILLTLSHNLQYVKDNHKLLYTLDVWSQAAIYKTTGHRLVKKVIGHTPDVLVAWSKRRLDHAIQGVIAYPELLPASINKTAPLNNSSLTAPLAIDYQKTYGIEPAITNLFDRAARGEQTAKSVIVTYAGADTISRVQNIEDTMAVVQNRAQHQQRDYASIEQRLTALDSELATLNAQHQRINTRAAGAAGLISAGVALFQLRSVYLSQSNLAKMRRRNDRAELELMTGYTSSVLATSAAGLDVLKSSVEMRSASSVWVTRLGMSVGVIGVIGAGFEYYSLELTQQRMHDSGSKVSSRAIEVAQTAAITAGVGGLLMAFSVSIPFLGAIIAVAWGISLLAQWVAYRYDKSHILPIHYWLDAGVFGNRAMLDVNDYPLNPFAEHPMANLEQDIYAYRLALTQVTVTPNFQKSQQGNANILTGNLTISINQWQDNSWLSIFMNGIDKQGNIVVLDRNSGLTFNVQPHIDDGSYDAKVNKNTATFTIPTPKVKAYSAPISQSYWGVDSQELLGFTESMKEIKRLNSQENSGIIKLEIEISFVLDASYHPEYKLRQRVYSQ